MPCLLLVFVPDCRVEGIREKPVGNMRRLAGVGLELVERCPRSDVFYSRGCDDHGPVGDDPAVLLVSYVGVEGGFEVRFRVVAHGYTTCFASSRRAAFVWSSR